MYSNWQDGSVAAYLDGKKWKEIFAMFSDIKPEAIRAHVRRSAQYRELHTKEADAEQPRRIRTLIVSDLHYPFHRPTIIDELRPFAGQVDNLLLSEENDFHGISRFQKMYRKSPMQEMIGTRQLLIDIMDTVKPTKTTVIKANHPARLGASLSKSLDPEMLRFSPATSSEYIIEDGFRDYNHETHQKEFYEALNKRYRIEYVPDWYVKLGHHVYCHPDAYRSPVMGTAEIVGKYFVDKYRDVDSVSVAHTHHSGVYPYGSVTLYETGCCCLPCNYNLPDAKRPWSFALFLLVQDEDGNNMKNETRHIWLD